MNIITHNIMVFIQNKFYVATIGGMLAIAVTGIMLSNGVTLSPDGWGYWEGSVSLLHGNGYEYFGGQSITAFPPLFSMLLSIIQYIIGVSGYSIVIFITILSGITAFTWIYLFLTISNVKNTMILNVLFLIGYIVSFVGAYYTALLAETFSLFLLGISLLLIVQMTTNPITKPSIKYLLPIIFTALLLTKNANISLLPGYFYVIASSTKVSKPKRLALGLLLTAVPVVLWMITRHMLGQSQSHPVVFSGIYSTTEYISQFIHGLSLLLGPSVIGVVLLIVSFAVICFLILLNRNTEMYHTSLMQISIIILSGVASLFLLFNMVVIHDKFQGRFIWVLPVFMVGMLTALYSWEKSRAKRSIILLLVALITLIQVERTTEHISYRLQNSSPPNVLLYHTIDPNYFIGPQIQQGRNILITPPEFSWINRRPNHAMNTDN